MQARFPMRCASACTDQSIYCCWCCCWCVPSSICSYPHFILKALPTATGRPVRSGAAGTHYVYPQPTPFDPADLGKRGHKRAYIVRKLEICCGVQTVLGTLLCNPKLNSGEDLTGLSHYRTGPHAAAASSNSGQGIHAAACTAMFLTPDFKGAHIFPRSFLHGQSGFSKCTEPQYTQVRRSGYLISELTETDPQSHLKAL